MAVLRVEVVYALPGEAQSVTLELPAGSCVQDALAASGLLKRMGNARWGAGRFGVPVDAGTALRDGDRIDICRPLVVDPGEARRRRASRRR